MICGSVIAWNRLTAVLFLLSLGSHERSCEALQYHQIETYATGDECALILDGPGRSSAFDYSYNLLRGSFPPTAGARTCITYDAVNHAYIEARKRINVAQPKTEIWRPEDLATVGELLLDISVNIAQTYGLSYEDIEKSLPLIDTSKTLIREICPAYLSRVECHPGKYRRYDGLCTNLENPTWGATLTPFTRLLSPRFADGMTAPRISLTGHELPLARVVSRTMHPDDGYHDHAGTVMVIAWGQFMDHDYTLTGTPLDAMNRNDPEECCSRPPHLKNPYCNEILIPEDDYFYRSFNVRCMDFVRAFPAPRPGCRLGSRVPFNLLTGVLDANTVYGISEEFSRKLRTGYAGLLRMNPVFSEYGLKDLLPLKLDIPDEGCTRHNRSMYCFEAGEIRVNEQLVLTCMHTLMAREHNRAAKALSQVNPHWDDETLFQEARRIVIAEIQHVTYNEFLPILLGKDVMEKFGLLLEKHDYWDGYDASVNPGVIDAFASAAFRFGHSLLPTAVERWSKAHKFIASKRLSDLIRRPYDLYRAGVLDEYFMGLMNQVAQAMDDSITQEVTNHLFKKVGAKFGMDLVSFNMQRGREFGIPSYMEFRKFCGLPGADSFEEMFGSMPNETIRRYSAIFESPSDVDLWSGGVSERPLPGSMLGPTFACVIATQFSYSRRGDRFWYELPNQPSSFTLDQLNEIRKAKLARLICDNTDLIDTIQIYPMVLPDHEINPRVPCRSGVLPTIDFSKWAEFPPTGQASPYQLVEEHMLDLPVAQHVAPPVFFKEHISQIFFEKTTDQVHQVDQPQPQATNFQALSPLVYARVLQIAGREPSPKRRMFPWTLARERARLYNKNKLLLQHRKKLRQNRSFNYWPLSKLLRNAQAGNEIWPKLYRKENRDYPAEVYRLEVSQLNFLPGDGYLREKRFSMKKVVNDDMDITTVIESIRRRVKRDASSESDSLVKTGLENAQKMQRKELRQGIESDEKDSRILNVLIQGKSRRDLARKMEHGRNPLLRNPNRRNKRSTPNVEDKASEGNVEEQKASPSRPIYDLRHASDTAAQENVKLVTNPKKSRLKSYTPVFKECNHTASSEVSDLNILPPITGRGSRQFTTSTPIPITITNAPQWNIPAKTEVKPILRSNDKDGSLKVSRKSPVTESSTRSTEEGVSTDSLSNVEEAKKNTTYINLQDHQKDVKNTAPKDSNGYPLDIQPYNPDVIPYVDVPDYSDTREESLDKDDRRVAKEKYSDDEDAIDPTTPLDDEKPSERIIVEGDNHEPATPRKIDEPESPPKIEEEPEPLRQIEDEPELPRQQEDEPEYPRRLQDQPESSQLEDDSESSRKQEDEPEYPRKFEDESEDSQKGEDVVNEDDEDGKRSSYEDTDESVQKNEQQKGDQRDPGETAKPQQEETFDFEPVNFDINEYKKPFNLEELFKEHGNPGKEMKQEKNEFKNERESSLDATDGYGSQESGETREPNEFVDKSEDVDGNISSGDETSASDKPEDTKDLPYIKDEEFRFGDKDFFAPFLEGRISETSEQSDKGDILSKYFSESVPSHLVDEREEGEEEKEAEETSVNQEAYKTLATILNKKNDVSRLNPELNEKAKAGNLSPAHYNNYWALEYSSPRRGKNEKKEY